MRKGESAIASESEEGASFDVKSEGARGSRFFPSSNIKLHTTPQIRRRNAGT